LRVWDTRRDPNYLSVESTSIESDSR
jgi:hypothetical protein